MLPGNIAPPMSSLYTTDNNAANLVCYCCLILGCHCQLTVNRPYKVLASVAEAEIDLCLQLYLNSLHTQNIQVGKLVAKMFISLLRM